MKKFEGMLFCTDLDGTLFCDDKTVLKPNLDAIEYFKSEGGFFTFITGRVPLTAMQIYDIIKPNAPFGCMNGGGVYDAVHKRYLWNAVLPADFIELVREVDRCLPDIAIQCNTENQIYFNKENSVWDYFRAVTGVQGAACHFEEVKEPVLKVVFGHEDQNRIENLAKLLANHEKAGMFDFIRSEKALYEMLPKGVSKGTALCKMAKIVGVSRNKTIAVGDYDNDVSMVSAAGLGFAVANAIDEVKKVADFVTVSNNENAIAAIIDGLDCGRFKI